jgi:glucosamine kinase
VAYFLGIDGGGSKTTCVVGDDRSRLATITAGPSNITRVGEVRAREALHAAIREACEAAKIDPRQIQRSCIGAAGAGREEIAEAVLGIIKAVLPGEIEVVGDMQIALEAAFGDGPGVMVVAGTGSIAYGRDAQGRSSRAGGWGFAISDEGSAHWIGRTTVAMVLRAIDEEGGKLDSEKPDKAARESSALLRELKAGWNLGSVDEFLRKANASPDFAALFPAILASANVKNRIAVSVLKQAGHELAQLASMVVRRLFARGDSDAPAKLRTVPLATAGGVFRHSALVREVFSDAVRGFDTRVELNPIVVEPVVGALQMARRGRTARQNA